MTLGLWATAVGSTLAWAVFDAIRKALVGRVQVFALSFWVAVAQVPGYLLWLALEGFQVPGPGYYWPALASIALNLLANLLFLETVRVAPLSTVVPLLSVTPVFVALLGIPFLGEHLGWVQWVGVLLVGAAALFLSLPEGAEPEPRVLVRAFLRQPGLASMAGVALLWALTPIADKLALGHAKVGLHGLVLSLGVAVGMAVVLLARRETTAVRQGLAAWPLVFVGGGVNVLALGLQLVAITGMVVSLFEAQKRALGLLLALGSGYLFFAEPVTRRKILAGVLMATGVALVLVGAEGS